MPAYLALTRVGDLGGLQLQTSAFRRKSIAPVPNCSWQLKATERHFDICVAWKGPNILKTSRYAAASEMAAEGRMLTRILEMATFRSS